MNITKAIKISIWAVFLSLHIGCSDWLDVQPVDRIPEEQLYTTESGFMQGLNGIYVDLNHTDLYGDELLVNMVEILAQR